MNNITLIIGFCLLWVGSAAQEKSASVTADEIVREGKSLYYLEKASWYGSDLFREKYNNAEKVGGYFSYRDGTSIKNVFFSGGLQVKVIGTTEFDSTVNKSSAKIDFTERNLTKEEQELFIIRSLALKAMTEDTFFKRYGKTRCNPVPLISNGEKKVYLLTASAEDSNYVLFGNDYLLRFDDSNKVISKKKFHNTLIPARYGEFKGQQITNGIHSHIIDDLISPTDICTIMLYEKIARWDEYITISKNYVSVWDCGTDQLTIRTSEESDTYFSKKNRKKRRKHR